MVSDESSFSEDSENETSTNSELPHGSEKDLIVYYFNRGFTYKHIALMLEKHHNIVINQRTLKRRLKDYGLSRRHEVDDELRRWVRDIILLEIKNGPDSLNGYRTMWHILRIRHHINVPWHVVEQILREVDPQGVEERKHRCLKRRTYVSPGPNFCWHIDGYDKLKPFSFSIHGCVDGFSRRILWLEVQRYNKNPRSVAKYFLKYVKAARGCPTRVYTDPGTENNVIFVQKDPMNMQAQSHTNMSPAPVIRESSASGHTSRSNAQVGGSISFMISTSLIYLISQVKFIEKHCGFLLQIYYKRTLIR